MGEKLSAFLWALGVGALGLLFLVGMIVDGYARFHGWY